MLVDVLATDDDEEYVVEVETTKRRVGRPRKVPEKFARYEVQVPPELLDAFTECVGGLGRRADVIRELMQRYVDDCKPQR